MCVAKKNKLSGLQNGWIWKTPALQLLCGRAKHVALFLKTITYNWDHWDPAICRWQVVKFREVHVLMWPAFCKNADENSLSTARRNETMCWPGCSFSHLSLPGASAALILPSPPVSIQREWTETPLYIWFPCDRVLCGFFPPAVVCLTFSMQSGGKDA